MSRVLTAHALRAPQQRGVSSRAWGSLLGQILLRTYDRALVIHQAMLLRGFNGNYPVATPPRFAARDALFVAGWTIFLLAARRFNFAELIGSHLLSGGA